MKRRDVGYWHLADIRRTLIHVRYWGYSGHRQKSRDVR
jgi:hypothetical protein